MPFEAGDAAAAVRLATLEVVRMEVTCIGVVDVLSTTTADDDITVLTPCAALVAATPAAVLVLFVVVGGCAAASVATLPVSVVNDLGTAVHLCPFIEVIENPAGRALVAMLKRKKRRHQSLERKRNVTIQ